MLGLPDFTPPPSARPTAAIALGLVACVALVYLLKVPGLFISLMLLAAAWLAVTTKPTSSENTALRTSISLSAEDIRDTLSAFVDFETSMEADAIADRTLHRPALLDLDGNDPDIEAFHYQVASAKRYLKRLPARMANPMLDTNSLEQLLSVTDQRAASLQEAWLNARRAALKLGPDYKLQHLADDQDESRDDSGSQGPRGPQGTEDAA